MYLRLAKRLLVETDKRLLWKLFWNMGVKGLRSVQRHKSRLKRGEFFPPYLYISLINSCNLRCQGCWVDVAAKQEKIEVAAMDEMIDEAKRAGNSFFGILGGEPFMHADLLTILGNHPDVYFQVFTNGHFITADVAKELRRLGNVTPLISVEGDEIVSDERRGHDGVYSRTMAGLRHCLDNKVMTGVCTSVCQSNIDDLMTDAWVDRLIEMGVLYCWFHIYRPVGPDPCADLSLTPEQQRYARQFVVDARVTKPIIVIDAYHDADGNALCPAAIGFTHHISPWGDIEPCPIIQFAKDSIYDEKSLRETFNESEFLRDFRRLAAESTRGCVALERPDVLEELIEKHGARDSTARGSAADELRAMQPRPSQYNPGGEIPERSWAYRLAKRIAFHDYGAYTKHFEPDNWRETRGEAQRQSELARITETEQ
ncbi:MAG: radical SAM protein [Pirellulaceae bacterium]|jgi:MoaA/NifB/PqqE/SkfB family radical SAM enzyme|nr:radical SAM protein [Pirellulaceae bacterium]